MQFRGPTNSPGSQAVLRRLNAGLVLRTAREKGALSRADIARQTGLSKPTVTQAVEFLVGAGYLEETRPNPAVRPGRRGRPVQVRQQLGCVLGIDIGADNVLSVVANLSGQTLGSARRRVGARGHPDAQRVLDLIGETARSALSEAAMTSSDVKAIGVGTPGVVDPATGRVTLAAKILGWDTIRVADALRDWFQCRSHVDNEVNLAVLAEQWQGAAEGIGNAVYVNLGMGIGAGILIDGKLYRGAHGAAGEIGYLPFSVAPANAMPSNRLGPFEQAAAGGAFARGGRQLVIDEAVGMLARRIAAISAVLDPAIVIVGSGLSNAGTALVEPITAHLQRLVPFPPRVVASSLGDHAVALGAVRLALHAIDDDLFASFVAGATGSGRHQGSYGRALLD